MRLWWSANVAWPGKRNFVSFRAQLAESESCKKNMVCVISELTKEKKDVVVELENEG
jgi:hypothetical protein